MKKQMKPVAKKAISEYGGMEKYPNKAAMKKHEKSEGMKMEMKEKMMAGKMKKKK